MRLGVHMTGAGVGASTGDAGKYMGRDMPCRLQPLRCLHVTAMQPSCRVPCAGDEAVLGNCTVPELNISGLLDYGCRIFNDSCFDQVPKTNWPGRNSAGGAAACIWVVAIAAASLPPAKC